MLDWLSTYSEALFGFLGVIIGGFITFVTERHFRKKDRFTKNRINYMLAMNQLSKVYSEQLMLLKAITQYLPERRPDLFVNKVMPVFSNSTKQIEFNVERLLTLAVKKKSFFNDIQLSFDRYDAVIQLFKDYQIARHNLEKYLKIEALHLDNNSAIIEFDLSDNKAVTQLVTTENLLRILISHLNENILDCRKLLTEISQFGDKKYKTEYKFLKTPTFPSYINNIKKITIGDLPPFQKQGEF